MRNKKPVLLSFHAISNGSTTLVFGQLIYTRYRKFSFTDYSRMETFRRLAALYLANRSRNCRVELVFDSATIEMKTDRNGLFFGKRNFKKTPAHLEEVRIMGNTEVHIPENLYTRHVRHLDAHTLVISDIDDTLLHSFISKKLLKFKTLMLTRVEKRKTVDNMVRLVNRLHEDGAALFYLSNSEQNLYPLIYRFLRQNNLPPGPVFLKHFRKMRHVLTGRKLPRKDLHKLEILEEIIQLFPAKSFVLVGDNTQNDLSIYMQAAADYPKQIIEIVIRRVVESERNQLIVDELRRN
ncbi:phosphatase domain-containing protein [Prolixibacter bellariivorans]|uniref:phosphatase domain-containing protein n=1 Tax=Prolixibacter bellariivorans TaxID=314319 RepID=UPI0004709BEB|nr:App1 family protein [Prolixibacter bellariivorans]